MLTKIIEFSLRQRIIVTILACLLLAYGVFSFVRIPIDAFPDVSSTQVKIIMKMPGASPEEVENRVVRPLELELLGLQGQTSLRSISKFAIADITINFEDSVNMNIARQMVNERLITAMPELPAGVTGGLAPIVTPLSDMYMFTIEGNISEMQKRQLLDFTIRPALRSIKGVADVSSYGGQAKAYVVIPDFHDMAKLGISISDLESVLRENLKNDGAGIINRPGEMYLVKIESAARDIKDIENISMSTPNGYVRIKDFAEVIENYRTRLGFVTIDGKYETTEGIVLGLRGSNSRDTIKAVEKKLNEIKANLPNDVIINTFYNRSDLTQKAVDSVIKVLAEAIILIIIVLFLFLGDLRAAVAVSVILPLALSVAFVLMEKNGLSANLMSLGGLIIAVGILVDSAVVVVENAFERLSHEKNLTKIHTIYRASKEIAPSVVSGIVIIIVFFVPILTLEGLEGKMFVPLGETIVYALIGSLVLSITIIPVMCSLVLKVKPHKETLLIRAIEYVYYPMLRFCLNNGRTVIIASIIFLVFTFSLFPHIGRAFMPTLDEGDIVLTIETTPSTSLKESRDILLRITKQIMDSVPDIKTIITRAGADELGLDLAGLYQSDSFIILKPEEEWESESKKEIIDKIHDSVKDFKGTTFIITQPIDMRISEMVTGVRGDLAIKIFGSDIDELNNISTQIAEILKSIQGNKEVYTALNKGVNYLYITPQREKMARANIGVEEFSKFLKSSLEGLFVDYIPQGFARTPVIIRQHSDIANSVSRFKSLELSSEDDLVVPINSIADIKDVDGPISIMREQSSRVGVVRSNVEDRDLGGFVDEAMARISAEVKLPEGYTITYGGQFENQQRANARFATVIPLSILVIFFILFFTFRSITLAFMILLNIPFAVTGGLVSLYISGEYFSVPASVGFIALFGIAVLNGLVMVGYFVHLIKQGHSISDAVEMGAKRRLRPVLMTASIAALGLVPMLIGGGVGSEVQRPLAIVVLGGLVTSSALTLLILPPTFKMIASKFKIISQD
ncbi:CusA/CzcA family heavy metal efflux RND transporter [Helicobacter muridarum]|uniref:Cadmium-zinc-nickel resistance protein CznA n=1 Tax=Helicobacter muridarum TaxID=216 RepID=A0A099TVG8_9HELI|nr:efflux RND transporter permease subunit [Helicobacter muridarum]TLE01733.1 CusA/CzcA family heavy metal efflux RND transporter [Helicobacter muridarum]STQ86266.1 cadmium-zinc-nickel resistance protein CznA [Helicobacter muridarum]